MNDVMKDAIKNAALAHEETIMDWIRRIKIYNESKFPETLTAKTLQDAGFVIAIRTVENSLTYNVVEYKLLKNGEQVGKECKIKTFYRIKEAHKQR